MQGAKGPWNCTGPGPMRSDITVVQEDARQRGPVRRSDLGGKRGGIKGRSVVAGEASTPRSPQ